MRRCPLWVLPRKRTCAAGWNAGPWSTVLLLRTSFARRHWRWCDSHSGFETECFRQAFYAGFFDNEKRCKPRELGIFDRFIPTIVENEPFAVVAYGKNGVILANGLVVHEHHAQPFVGHSGLMQRHVFSKRIVLAVARSSVH